MVASSRENSNHSGSLPAYDISTSSARTERHKENSEATSRITGLPVSEGTPRLGDACWPARRY